MIVEKQQQIDSLTKIEWLLQLLWIFCTNHQQQQDLNYFVSKSNGIRSLLFSTIGNDFTMILFVCGLINQFVQQPNQQHQQQSIPLFLNLIHSNGDAISLIIILRSLTLAVSLSNKIFLSNVSQFILSKKLENVFSLELFKLHVVQNLDEFSTSFKSTLSLSKSVPSLAFILFQSLLNWISSDLRDFSKLPEQLKGKEFVLIVILCTYGSELVSQIIEVGGQTLLSTIEFLISLPTTKFNSVQSISTISLQFYEKLLSSIFDRTQNFPQPNAPLISIPHFLSKLSNLIVGNNSSSFVDRFVECTQILFSNSIISESDKKAIIATISNLQPSTPQRDEVLKYWSLKK